MARPPDTFASPGARRFFLVVLLLVSLLSYTDRVIFSMLADLIKRDLQISDFAIGLASGITFAAFQALFGIPIARLAERRSRVKIIAICTGVWSLMTAACGLAANFAQFVLCRIGVSIGEAGYLPSTTSLVGDRFREDRRGSAMGIVQLGSPLSGILAALLTVFVAARWGWRAAFIAAGLPGLIAMLLVFTLKEPRRGESDDVRVFGEVPGFVSVLRALVHKASYRHVVIAATLTTFGVNGVSQFLVPFYSRSFGLTVGQAAMMYAAMGSIAAFCAMLIAGYGMDWAGRIDRKWHAWIPALGVGLSSAFYGIAFSRTSLFVAGTFVMLGGLTQFLYFVPTVTMVQNMVGPTMRASAIAVSSVLMSLVGGGFGPVVTGWMSDRFARRAFAGIDFETSCAGGHAAADAPAELAAACAQASAQGLRYSFIALSLFFAWAALHFFLAGRFVHRDAYSTTLADARA